MEYKVKITNILSLTHDVKRITTEKPEGYSFNPGQATEVAINKPGFEDQKRPFIFTSLPGDDYLEFTIKSYRDHNGVTYEVDSLVEGDELIIGESWGAIKYKGRGTFIVGGAGITPFIAILRDLQSKNQLIGHKLIFSNKTSKDVIMEADFQEMLGENFTSTITQEKVEGHEHKHINMDFLKKHVEDYSQEFYICGPGKMTEEISQFLEKLGAKPDALTFEK